MVRKRPGSDSPLGLVANTFRDLTEAMEWLRVQVQADSVFAEMTQSEWVGEFMAAAITLSGMADTIALWHEDSEFLDKLRAAGVDSWEGYDHACSM